MRSTMGIVSPACEKAGIDRSTYYEWYKNDAEFKAAVDDITEIVVDFGESKLYELVNVGDINAIKVLLNAKGKKRGYGANEKDAAPAAPPTPEASGRKLVIYSIRKRPESPPAPAAEPQPAPTNLPAKTR